MKFLRIIVSDPKVLENLIFLSQEWGKLQEHSKTSHTEFVESLGKFVGILSSARDNMAGR